MELSEKLQEAVERHERPYIKELAFNMQQALSDAIIKFDRVNIYVYVNEHQQPNIKQWLHDVLEKLPDINHPIERVGFVIYVNDIIEEITLINPTENDVRALEYAIDSKLKFSQPSKPYSDEPLPLNHPYYTDKDWLKKNKGKLNLKDVTFDDIKDLPNVKPVLENIKKQRIRI